MIRRPLSSLFLCVLVPTMLCAPAQAQEPPSIEPDSAKRAAHVAAQTWLRRVDDGAWGPAWDEAASLLRDAVPRERWRKQGARARDTLGALRSRRLARGQYRDTLRQATGAGPFVLLQYRSSFESGLYLETVLAVRADETWTVAGYEVAPVTAPANRKKPLPQND